MLKAVTIFLNIVTFIHNKYCHVYP